MKYSRELQKLATIETLASTEFRVQFVVVLVCILTAILATSLWPLGIWFILHYSLAIVERVVATKFAKNDSATSFYIVLGLNLAVGITFAALPVYLWMQESPSFHFAAMALLVGSTLNTFLIRSTLWYLAVCFVVPNAGAFLIIVVMMSLKGLPAAEAMTLLVITLATMIYFAVSVIEMHRMHLNHDHTLAQLWQSQKNEVVGHLTGGVAHDFNNLLNVISGYLEIARSEDIESERKIAVEGAIEATKKGAKLVHQLLAFARRSRLENRTISVDPILDELMKMAQRVIPARIRVELREPDSALFVTADTTLLTTALLNLLVNARDAIHGSGYIEVSATKRSGVDLPKGMRVNFSERDFILFSVTDNGSGIEESILDRVTEPFFTTKPIGSGSGLGLSMVYGFVQQSGGSIKIESRVGSGTTVLVALPAGEAEQVSSGEQENEVENCDTSGTVLVVEDQPELRQMIMRVLQKLGLSCLEAASADAAWAMLEEGLRPSLLITDAVMPGDLQLPEFLAKTRLIHPIPQIIVISGYDELQIRGDGSELYGSTFLQKPFSLSVLSKMVQDRLRP